MPFNPPFDEMLRNVSPLAPMVVPVTFKAVPVVVVSVLDVPVTLTVPPPFAVKALLMPVLAVMPPVKLIVLPGLVSRLMPSPVSLMAPVKAMVPPVWLVTSTERPAGAVVIVLAKV